jgi:hypothetical protein
MLGEDSSRPLGMTAPVISNEVRDLSPVLFFKGVHEAHEVKKRLFEFFVTVVVKHVSDDGTGISM